MGTLWAPLEVEDLDRSAAFYEGLLRLSPIDAWQRDGERGAVYDAGGGRIEIVQPPSRTAPPAYALELPDRASVDAVHQAAGPAAETSAGVFPRGHYGFVLADPDGHRVLIWTEGPEGEAR
ncbi:MAG: VOC family protein [Hamadaea sp.]|nr:VOC family protein [Hamadaea sp.]